jgi:hypothetical protein
VNHRIFERILRSLVFRGACLFECRELPQPLPLRGAGLDLDAAASLDSTARLEMHQLVRRKGIDKRCDKKRFVTVAPFDLL